MVETKPRRNLGSNNNDERHLQNDIITTDNTAQEQQENNTSITWTVRKSPSAKGGTTSDQDVQALDGDIQPQAGPFLKAGKSECEPKEEWEEANTNIEYDGKKVLKKKHCAFILNYQSSYYFLLENQWWLQNEDIQQRVSMVDIIHIW